MEMVEIDDDDDDYNDVADADAYEKDDCVSLTLDDHDRSRTSSSSLKKRRSSSSASGVHRSSYKSQFRPLLLSHYRRSSTSSSC